MTGVGQVVPAPTDLELKVLLVIGSESIDFVEQSAYQPSCKRQPHTIQEAFKDLSVFYLMCLDCSGILASDRLLLSFLLS